MPHSVYSGLPDKFRSCGAVEVAFAVNPIGKPFPNSPVPGRLSPSRGLGVCCGWKKPSLRFQLSSLGPLKPLQRSYPFVGQARRRFSRGGTTCQFVAWIRAHSIEASEQNSCQAGKANTMITRTISSLDFHLRNVNTLLLVFPPPFRHFSVFPQEELRLTSRTASSTIEVVDSTTHSAPRMISQ